ncbi:transposable element Tc3 transposase [Trichonephila clavipes]|nr:transposable element Tc3 transposase [Trichonephila clavipes]
MARSTNKTAAFGVKLELWFQQDGATCHIARATIYLLKDTFGDRLISRLGPVNCPPRSCDLTPLDYFLWGYVKSLVYADKPQTLDHLEDNIHRAIADTWPQMLEKVSENWTSRLDYIRASRGSPMPEIIFKISLEKQVASHISVQAGNDWFRPLELAKEIDLYNTSQGKSLKPLPNVLPRNNPVKNASREYEDLGHMREIKADGSGVSFYMPHHGVYRPEKSTTKLRTVFNASSPSTSGKSLNSIQFNGGLVQEDLFSIMVRFEKHNYTRAFGDGPRNFEPWSSDVDDT